MFDAKKALNGLVRDVKAWFDSNAPKASAVIGISGGKDSTVTAAILARALGKDRVVGVLMPNGTQSDIDDSWTVINALGIKGLYVDINAGYTGLIKAVASAGDFSISDDTKVNLQPRLRMATLYAVAQSLPNGGIVINTCNKSEDYIGYATKFGDCAGDMSVLRDFLVSEIYAIGDLLTEVPAKLVHKTPSDGLWGDSDEDHFGFTYASLENYIKTGKSGNVTIDKKIEHMHHTSRHKYEPMYVCPNIGK